MKSRHNPNNGAGSDCPEAACSTFQFRAECETDVNALVSLIPPKSIVRFTSLREAPFPDEICEIEVRGFNLAAMREFCRSVEDGHVMLQTIQPKDKYTGERDYDLI
jgi:hypothetical protein